MARPGRLGSSGVIPQAGRMPGAWAHCSRRPAGLGSLLGIPERICKGLGRLPHEVQAQVRTNGSLRLLLWKPRNEEVLTPGGRYLLKTRKESLVYGSLADALTQPRLFPRRTMAGSVREHPGTGPLQPHLGLSPWLVRPTFQGLLFLPPTRSTPSHLQTFQRHLPSA